MDQGRTGLPYGLAAAVLLLGLGLPGVLRAQDGGAAGERLRTRWAADVDPALPLPAYPRPQMIRPDWRNLNGPWAYALTAAGPAEADPPAAYPGQILVPFAIEASLSGVGRMVGRDSLLWYRRTFEVPRAWQGRRLLLHFGAVDWAATVYVNGVEVGAHRGGYDPFTFDVTEALREGPVQELVVSVWDPTDDGYQPHGKQTDEPRGIMYTPVTGIWQTVWIEPVPARAIDAVHTTPDVDAGTLTVRVRGRGTTGGEQVRVTALAEGRRVATATGAADAPLVVSIPEARRWSPETPFLYDLRVELLAGGTLLDAVDSYFGMREIEVAPDASGTPRLMLNDAFVFQYGTLDQGYWPDGLYTAPTEAAMRYDIEFLKAAGFNTLRKHVKVEPARYYYLCDSLGMLVWQDMPSRREYHLFDLADEPEEPAEVTGQFELELERMIEALQPFPSIVVWVPFNEGWGQYDTSRITAWLQRMDPTRLVDSPSGWTDVGVGDVFDAHRYPGPGRIEAAGPARAFVVGEFGGLGYPVEGHLWDPGMRNWGYVGYEDLAALEAAYTELAEQVAFLKGRGLSAAIYTQTTDVEGEVNGLLTYDRAVAKIPAERLAEIHRPLHAPPPRYRPLHGGAGEMDPMWRYTTTAPGDGWQQADYDDGAWPEGRGYFGRLDATPKLHRSVSAFMRGAAQLEPATAWATPALWLRRVVVLEEVPERPYLYVRHDDDADVYINGRLAASFRGRPAHYPHHTLRAIGPLLQPGENIIAVYATNDMERVGHQSVDVRLLERLPAEEQP